MDIARRISQAKDLTPTERAIADKVLQLGEGVMAYSIKEFAAFVGVSVPSVHRFCKKVGLEGYKELKVEVARSAAARANVAHVDVNFPFPAGSTSAEVTRRMRELYQATVDGTIALLDDAQMEHAAELAIRASVVDIYAQSHNTGPAQTFAYRLMSIGVPATAYVDSEALVRCALMSDSTHVAVCVSYSGRAPILPKILPILHSNGTPVVLVGTPEAAKLHPGLAAYLSLANQESLNDRITQFSSHLAVLFVLDVLYGSMVARTYEKSLAFQRHAHRYTTLPGSA